MRKFLFLFALAFLFFAFSSTGAAAQTKTRVRFAKGATSATVRGIVKGYAYRNYLFSAREGQRVSISLDSRYPHPEIVVRDPAGENLHAGEGSWNGHLPMTGSYTVRVLLPRAFARRGQLSSYDLTIEIE